MKLKIFFIIGLASLLQATTAFASPFGISYSQIIIPKDPDNLHGGRLGAFYQPNSLMWEHVQVYFDASVGRYWLTGKQPYRSVTSFAVAPYLRYWLIKKPIFSPYVEISIGPAYVSKTKIGEANLGMHFIFQDQATIGAAWGKEQKFSTTISVVHYSNGSLCDHNSGITVPLMLNLGYRF